MSSIEPIVSGSSWTLSEVGQPSIPDRSFSVTDYGAVGDGVTDNTEAFHKAIAACSQAGGGRVVIPAGVWLTGPLSLASRLDLHAQAGALVLFSRRFEDYPMIFSQYEGQPSIRCQSPLDGEGLEHVAITGAGVFDGGGDAWRPVKDWKMTEKHWAKLIASGGVVDEDAGMWWPSEAAMNGPAKVAQLKREGSTDPKDYEAARDYLRPNLLSLRRCKYVLLEGATFQNSPAWNLHPWACEHVTLRGVTVRNPWYGQNGDGLDLDSCRYGLVEDCSFDVGDDAICIKSGKDEAGRALGIPCEDILIRNCRVYHGHGGFVIGSEMSGGVRRLRVEDCTFMGTDIGLRFKSTRGRGGLVEDIEIERIRMNSIVGEAISFHLFYEGKEGSGVAGENIVPVSVETPIFRGITIRDVQCAGAETALLINGLPEMPLDGLVVENFTASAKRGGVCTNAQNLTLKDVTLHVEQGPVVSLRHAQHVKIEGLGGSAPEGSDMLQVSGRGSKEIAYGGIRLPEELRGVKIAVEVEDKNSIRG
ncbi:glycoside hydrolase family 28 [Paenibacillus mucilaginosus 3016]|uniref:Glycoside hydrolase family 28 n=2 Tax=Paenibacillus mucilaginosus TaxID=61624 RepID=H6NM33_9BACL|nr:glycoside hydrolase family 28 protein [Paenibacillus mucilaginosus]AFC32451.1 glycoside hydrolase family 28 [Paenibacillus mucilaginosus 3016]AFH64764.1 glycoside hydrolase [Paenibacillus mucilaginosus K02]WFA20934.1 glycoside hydrolase family 28 protein [Paenibacillus mucilaginosus]